MGFPARLRLWQRLRLWMLRLWMLRLLWHLPVLALGPPRRRFQSNVRPDDLSNSAM